MVDILAGKEVAPYDCVLNSVGKKSPTKTYIIAKEPLINNFPTMLHTITAVWLTEKKKDLDDFIVIL